MHILLTLSYDGTYFSGWQKQINQRTVQGELELALSNLLKKQVQVRGASRTDAGVHSRGQLALLKEQVSIPIDKLPLAINNSLQTNEIVITDAIYVNEDFHPQNSVYKKTYKYFIYNHNFLNPILRNYVEFVRKPLLLDKMKEASKYFIGEFDFKAFCSSKTQANSTVRTIYNLDVYENNQNLICIEVTGNGFLYNMVRIIVGTLIDVGLEKIYPQKIKDIILSCDRQNAGKTVSPNGLVLDKIYFYN